MQSDVNVLMIREVVRHIEIMPQKWFQGAWVSSEEERLEWGISTSRPLCGTSFCFAGWAARLAGYVDETGKPTDKGVAWMTAWDRYAVEDNSWLRESGVVDSADFYETVGEQVLGLTHWQASRIFAGSFASRVSELKEKLTAVLGITFEEGADPHAV